MRTGKPSRRLWIAALAVSLVCVGGLAYGLVTEWNTRPERELAPVQRTAGEHRGFSLGLVIGIGAGIVVGSLLAARKRDR